MTRERIPRTDLPSYFQGISRRLELQAEQMTPVIVHSGEMGDNDHAWFAELLRQYLPQKFGVDTGFVVNTESDKGSANFFDTGDKPRTQDPYISPQMDILLLDVLHNAPFCSEKTFKVCPIEMVLGAVEVTRTLDAGKLRADCDKLSRVKQLAGDKAYSPTLVQARWWQPITFVVGLTSSLSLEEIQKTHAHYPINQRPDCVFLLDKALYWFSQDGRHYQHIEKDRLYHFIASLRHSIDALPVCSVNLQAYLPADIGIHAIETGNATDTAQAGGRPP